MGRRKQIASPACPNGHAISSVIAFGTRDTSEGMVRRFRCTPEDADIKAHTFVMMVRPENATKGFLDKAIPPPACPLGHQDLITITRRGRYSTAGRVRQRYQCRNLITDDKHSFSAVLPRSQVAADAACDECAVPTPVNAGPEAAARRVTYPISVIHMVLKDLSEGRSYTATSLRALEATDRPTGPVRRKGSGQELALVGDVGGGDPARDGRAHWHVSADILETCAPLIVESAFTAIDSEEAAFREQGLPVVYMADDVDVKRKYARSRRYKMSPNVWSMLVVSRTRWDSRATTVNRSNRLLRVRALPNRTQGAWELVFGELAAPDFLVCDGASAISNAAAAVWGDSTTLIPCIYHATTNIAKGVTPAGVTLPRKVYDQLRSLTRTALQNQGPAMIGPWFDELDEVMAAAGLPVDSLWNLRRTYEPMLEISARIAQEHNTPEVPISNTGVESLIASSVKPVVERRGPMFTNLPRTNLLGDLIVAGNNGALLNARIVADALRDDNRAHAGWAAAGRAVTEPKGALGLRDPRNIEVLRQQASA